LARRASGKLAGGDNHRIVVKMNNAPAGASGKFASRFRKFASRLGGFAARLLPPLRGGCSLMGRFRWLRPPMADLPTG
jgi:hypothetical protein